MGEQVTFGRFVLERRLAIGGMAEVFLGRMPGPKGFAKQVVIKRILPHLAGEQKYEDMFLDEARVVARFNHPNVIQVYELAEIEGQYCLVMEYLEGSDLALVIERARKKGLQIPVMVAAQVVVEAADGLHYVHDLRDPDSGEPLSIVHRDISPHNIIATKHGIKVVDFGIAKHEQSESRTAKGVIKGKLAFMAPETIRGLPVDRRSDIFSLGAVLYELLTQKSCFHRNTPYDTADAIRNGAYPPPREHRPDLPEELEVILARMLAPDVRDRYPTAAQVATDLRQVIAQRTTSGAPVVSSFLGELFEREETRRFSAVGNDIEVPVDDVFSDPGIEVPEATRVELIAAARGEATRAVQRIPGVGREEPTVAAGSPMDRAERTVKVTRPVGVRVLEGTTRESALGPARAPSSTRWLAPLAVGLVLVAVAAGVGYQRCSTPRQTTVVELTETPAIGRPQPPLATPTPPRADPVRSPVPVPSAPDVSAKRPGKAGPGTRSAKRKPGLLSLTSDPPTTVVIDGRKLGMTPLKTELAPGNHAVELRAASLGIARKLTVRMRSGQTTKERVVFRMGKAIIRVEPWADVFIHGRKVGTTPMGPVNLYEGTHEVTLVNPELEVRRTIRVQVIAGETVGVSESL